MSKKEVSLCMNVNGESKVPPGFRFHPTEEELLHYYLRKKVAYQKIDLDVIREVDLNKLEPWDIQDKCKIGSTPQNDWYFFSHKDKKYPSGTRTNRATAAGFWKATGRDKVIHSRLQRIGMRKTLVFYKGRAPHGQKSDWIMHEYRLLDDHNIIPTQDSSVCDCAHEEGWVVCRVFKKKNYHKAIENPGQISKSDPREHELQSLNKDDVLEELLMGMDSISKSCKLENDNFTTTNNNDVMQQYMNPINNILVHIPGLDASPTISSTSVPHAIHSADFDRGLSLENSNFVSDILDESGQTKNVDTTNMMDYYDQCSNWADVDKFVAYQLDHGQMGEPNQTLCFSVDDCNEPADLPRPNELDIWSLARSSMEPLYHLSL